MISKKLRSAGAIAALSAALLMGSSVCAYANVPDNVDTQSTSTSAETASESQNPESQTQEAEKSAESGNTAGSDTESSSSEGRVTGTADAGSSDDSESGVLTPSGNLSLVDDVSGTDADQMDFMTVTSKDGHVFYIVVDHSSGTDNVYFLNQVDESDLMALMSDEEKNALETESGTSGTESSEEAVKPTVSDSTGDTADTAQQEQKEQAAKKNALNNNVIMGAVFGVIGLIVICAYYFLKIRPGKGGSSVADDLEFYDDEEYENEEETEPEFEEESGDTGRKPEKKDEDPKAAPEEGDHV